MANSTALEEPRSEATLLREAPVFNLIYLCSDTLSPFAFPRRFPLALPKLSPSRHPPDISGAAIFNKPDCSLHLRPCFPMEISDSPFYPLSIPPSLPLFLSHVSNFQTLHIRKHNNGLNYALEPPQASSHEITLSHYVMKAVYHSCVYSPLRRPSKIRKMNEITK